MCNKVSYVSKTEALKDAVFIKVNNRRYRSKKTVDKSSKLRAYLCPICDNWHLTSLARNVTRNWSK